MAKRIEYFIHFANGDRERLLEESINGDTPLECVQRIAHSYGQHRDMKGASVKRVHVKK